MITLFFNVTSAELVPDAGYFRLRIRHERIEKHVRLNVDGWQRTITPTEMLELLEVISRYVPLWLVKISVLDSPLLCSVSVTSYQTSIAKTERTLELRKLAVALPKPLCREIMHRVGLCDDICEDRTLYAAPTVDKRLHIYLTERAVLVLDWDEDDFFLNVIDVLRKLAGMSFAVELTSLTPGVVDYQRLQVESVPQVQSEVTAAAMSRLSA